MHTIISRQARVILVTLTNIVLFAGSVHAIPVNQDAGNQEGETPPLHYKSESGLMPPAYGLDPNAAIVQADPDAPRIEFLNAAENTETGSWLQVLVASNFDGENQADVAIAMASYFDDTGLITEPIAHTAFHLPSAVAVADINHDGREDVIAVHDAWRSLNVYTQTADLELAPYASIDVPYSSRYRPNAMALADYDGNGSLDVALVGQEAGLTILTNELTAPTSTILSPPEATTVLPGPLTVTGIASSSAISVEVRLRGGTDWIPATLTGNNWSAEIEMPAGGLPWTIEARAINADDYYQAPTARRRIRVAHLTYLPMIRKAEALAPDLVGSFSLSPNKLDFEAGEEVLVTITVTNQGTARADPFWVDLFINPSEAPTVVNTLWNHLCGLTPCHGIAWGVVDGLDPGESVTLTSTEEDYSNGHTIWPGYFVNGTSDLYLYVDIWDPGVATGAAAELNESNNRAELHGLQVTGENPVHALSQQAEELPPRPVLPTE